MKYLECINFYIQVRNQLDQIMANDITEEVTLDNVHLYFFDELEHYFIDGKTSLEVLTDIMINNEIDIQVQDDKITKTYDNYLKVRKLLKQEENEYLYDLLKINVNNYFDDNSEICRFSLVNFENILNQSLINIDKYKEIILYDYDYFVSLNETINLIKRFFCDIDTSNRLLSTFIEFLNDENVFIWNESNKERYDALKMSILVENCPNSDFYDGFVSKIGNKVFVNIYCRNNLLDSYNIIHEFLHYYVVRSINLEDENECSKFFAEFPSIFFEYLFNMYLKKNDLYEDERDIQIETRGVENIKNVFMMESTYKLYQTIENSDFDFLNFYDNFTNSLEYTNFMDKASFTYPGVFEQISDINKFYDLLNINLCEIDYSDVINYISATLFSEELIKLVENGKAYLIERLINVIHFLPYTEMDPLYVLNYLELNYRFLGFKQIGDKVIPKRLEKIK